MDFSGVPHVNTTSHLPPVLRPPTVLHQHRAQYRGQLKATCVCKASSSHSSTSAVAEQPHAAEASSSGRELRTGDMQSFSKIHRKWQSTATLKAHAFHAIHIEERQKPLSEYMALPASQYSVLDAQRIERIDDTTFCCYVEGVKFFGIRVEPVLTVAVVVGPKGPTVKLLSTVLEGSSVVEAANDRFDATMTNVITWSSTPDAGEHIKQMQSDASIQVSLEVPGWMRAIPVGAIERTGSSVMQRVLNRMLPRFLAQLEADYELWASGAPRKPVGTGQL